MKRKDYTITDIAESLQISTASVSRAISGAPGVSQGLRDKIIQFCNEIGYQPNATLRPHTHTNSNIISLILGDIRNPFYSNLTFTIQKHLDEHHYETMVFNSEYNAEKELEFIKIAEQFSFSGLILITAQSQTIAQKLNEISLPKVLVNRILPNYNGDSVLTDNFQAAYEAALHLINLGHHNIGYITGPENSSATTQRFAGFTQAMKNYGLSISNEFIWHSDLKLETGQAIAREFLKLNQRPTAIISINDMTSLGFIDICKSAGLQIPEDLSIISFDDIPIASLHDIQLTTLSQHVEEMGRIASDLILKQLNNPYSEPERIILTPEIIIRKTTGVNRER